MPRSTTIRMVGALVTVYPWVVSYAIALTTAGPPPTSYGPRLNKASTGLIPLVPSVEFRRVTVCSRPQAHSSVSRAISEVISLRALVMASRRMSSRDSVTSGVVTSSHHRLRGCLSSPTRTAFHRSPPTGHSSSGSSSRKVSLRRLCITTLKYAADAESAAAE